MLSLKQKRFCEEYAISGNATDAAKKAGYTRSEYLRGDEKGLRGEMRRKDRRQKGYHDLREEVLLRRSERRHGRLGTQSDRQNHAL